jgi:hypothetical protein
MGMGSGATITRRLTDDWIGQHQHQPPHIEAISQWCRRLEDAGGYRVRLDRNTAVAVRNPIIITPGTSHGRKDSLEGTTDLPYSSIPSG